MPIILIENMSDLELLVKKSSQSLVVIDCTASWCGPCKAIAPRFHDLSKRFPHVLFASVDVDEAPDVAQHLDVTAMPTFVLYHRGQVIKTIVGGGDSTIREIEAEAKQYSLDK